MTPRRSPAGRRRQPVGLALAGGGFLGAAYELGVLTALDEAVDGLDLNGLDSYVGVSAGAFIAAGLANGKTPQHMVRLFIDDSDPALDPAAMLQPSASLWWKALGAAPRVARLALQSAVISGRRGLSASLWEALEKIARTLPAGVLDASAAERTLRQLFAAEHGSDDFRRLPSRLRIVATDIDTGQPVEFGAPGFDDVPISRAVIASSAVPGIFAPVRIGQRYFVDGALNKTLHASVALNEGVKLLFCINPLVPFNSGAATRPGVIAKAGLTVILSQSIRTAIRSRMTTGLEKYSSTHPDARLIVLEPRSSDTELFFTGIFTVSARRRVCELAYQQTRLDLLERFAELNTLLEPHGMGLNRMVLTDPHLSLFDRQVRAPSVRRGRLGAATDDLRLTLNDLERRLRLARARLGWAAARRAA